MLYGAMVGTAFGGGVQVARETLGPILSRAAPYLRTQQAKEAAFAFDPKMKVTAKAARAGGIEELGETAIKHELIPDSPIEAAKQTPDDLLARTKAAKQTVGQQLEGILAKDTHEHTIRFAPPLVITGDQVDWALERIAATLTRDWS